MAIVLGILLLIILIVVISNIKIVPQASVYVVERLGTYAGTWETGSISRRRLSTASPKRFLSRNRWSISRRSL